MPKRNSKGGTRPRSPASPATGKKDRSRSGGEVFRASSGPGPGPAERRLREYRRKRDPRKTEEPFHPGAGEGFFVVQKHAASRLHYDFRLAMGGVLVSWAVPKGPSYDTRERRLAVHVEDHPLSYRDFEGTIPKGEYGGGSVIVWDTGRSRVREGSVGSGSLKLDLEGKKLVGGWALVRMKGEKDEWLLIKEKDEHADPEREVTEEEPQSVLSGLTIEEIGEQRGVRQWNSGVLRALEALPEGAAREGVPPEQPEFMKARLEQELPTGGDWVYEIKLDGVRAQALREDGRVRLVTRNLKEVAFRYPEIAGALEELAGGDFVMDGEIVAFDSEGRSRFELLQGRIHLAGTSDIAAAAEAEPAFYYAFDLLYAEGRRLEDAPLVERKRVLAGWLERAPRRVRYSDHVAGRGRDFLRLACERGLEGVIAKRADAPYRGTRSGEWVKVKCLNQQEFVIGGFTPPKGGRSHFGSLLLGFYEDGGLRYAGKVGTGFTEAALTDLHRRLGRLGRDTAPFLDPPRERGVRWVDPSLVAEVRYTEWTSDGKLRHPAFLALREDKQAREVLREAPGRAAGEVKRDAAAEAAKAQPPSAGRPKARPAAKGGKRGLPAKRGKTEPQGRRGNAAPPATRRKVEPPKQGRKADPRRRGAKTERPRKRAASGRRAPEVTVSHPEKVYFPRAGVTKGEVVEYYRAVAKTILPWLRERPLTLVRYPNGIAQASFFQKDQPEWLPEWIPTVAVASPGVKRTVDYLVCNDEPTLVYVANMGTLDLHPWASRRETLELPDYVVWDLDPPEGGFAKAAALAPRVREVLEGAGLESFLKTSGGKGLHLYVPLVPEHDHDAVRDFAQLIAAIVTDRQPRNATLERSKAARSGKVYVDFLQNGRGKTVVAPYSVRAKEPATVSMPITWEELEAGAAPQDFTIRTVPEILARRGDAWQSFRRAPARLGRALRRLGG
ncbi:MAG: non-homologous end-joining DNA ligase [Gemmatimonadota bacterium]